MPRKRRTQAPTAAPGQVYGVGGEQVAAQKAMPLPDNRSQPMPAASPGGPAPAPAAPRDPLAIAQALPFESLNLGGPSTRPDEPVTAGIRGGPGPGPEAVAPVQPTNQRQMTAKILADLATEARSPRLARLAARIQQGA